MARETDFDSRRPCHANELMSLSFLNGARVNIQTWPGKCRAAGCPFQGSVLSRTAGYPFQGSVLSLLERSCNGMVILDPTVMRLDFPPQ